MYRIADIQGLVHMKMMRKKRKQEEAEAAKAQKKGERVDSAGSSK